MRTVVAARQGKEATRDCSLKSKETDSECHNWEFPHICDTAG